MRILLINNNKVKKSLTKNSLETEYHVVDNIEILENGLSLAYEKNYGLLLFDLTGFEKICLKACLEIRAKKINTPILILSEKSETTVKVDMLNAGADDYLTKPFSVDELLARVRALLRRPQLIKNHILRIDNLFLNINKGEVKRGNRKIDLTRKLFILLRYFMENQGVILSRSMILEHVWDINADSFSNTIESHILSLRKKIDMPGAKKLIHTVNGRGYKMENV